MRARLGALALVVMATGCIGSTSRGSFEDEVHRRGGGLSQGLVLDAVDAVAKAQRSGGAQVRLVSVTVQPARVAIQAQVPRTTDDVDSYTFGSSGMYGGDGLDSPQPVHRSSTDQPLESATFTVADAGVRRLDRMVDRALDSANLPGGYATGATISRTVPGQPPQTVVTVTNKRRTVAVTLSPDAAVTGVQPE
jgi:hypothetical protein